MYKAGEGMNRGNIVFLAIVLIILSITGYLIYQGIKEGEKIEIYYKDNNIEVVEFKLTDDGAYLKLIINGESGDVILKFTAYKKIAVKLLANVSPPIDGETISVIIDPINNIERKWYTWWSAGFPIETNTWYTVEITSKNVTISPEPDRKNIEYNWGANPGYLLIGLGAKCRENMKITAEIYISRD